MIYCEINSVFVTAKTYCWGANEGSWPVWVSSQKNGHQCHTAPRKVEQLSITNACGTPEEKCSGKWAVLILTSISESLMIEKKKAFYLIWPHCKKFRKYI